MCLYFKNGGTLRYSPFSVVLQYKARNKEDHNINRRCFYAHSHWWEVSAAGVAQSRMVWVVGFKISRLPQVNLVYGFSFKIFSSVLVPILFRIIWSSFHGWYIILVWPKLFSYITIVINVLVSSYAWLLLTILFLSLLE